MVMSDDFFFFLFLFNDLLVRHNSLFYTESLHFNNKYISFIRPALDLYYIQGHLNSQYMWDGSHCFWMFILSVFFFFFGEEEFCGLLLLEICRSCWLSAKWTDAQATVMHNHEQIPGILHSYTVHSHPAHITLSFLFPRVCNVLTYSSRAAYSSSINSYWNWMYGSHQH